MNKTAVVLVGLPGIGKSTLIQKINQDGNIFVYSTDSEIERLAFLEGRTYTEAFDDLISTATKNMDYLVIEAVRRGEPIIWDQTNMSSKKRARILRKLQDYKVDCFCWKIPETADEISEHERRLASRQDKQIPSFVIENMKRSFQLPTVEEGFNSVTILDINGNPI